MSTLPARIIHVSIDRPWGEVYAFASNPRNMPLWASGLAKDLRPDGADWIGDGGPVGPLRVRFAQGNPHGILDHTVTLADGTRVDNAMRVVPNGAGAEVMFLLLKQPDMDDRTFEADAAHVLKDLRSLKSLLEEEKQAGTDASTSKDRKIDYVEFQVRDVERTKRFYGDAFGWSFTDYGSDYCEFHDGRLSGGFARSAEPRANGGPLVVLFADDLEDALARVENAGGRIVKPVFSFPGGRRFHFSDPEGYELAVWSER